MRERRVRPSFWYDNRFRVRPISQGKEVVERKPGSLLMLATMLALIGGSTGRRS